MDAGQAAVLTGPQLRELGEAISDAFGREALVDTLYSRLDKREWVLPDGDNYPLRIRRLLDSSRQHGWLHELVDALLQERPEDQRLKAWVDEHSQSVASRPSAPQQLFDTSNFDLEPLRKAVVNATWESTNRVLGLGFAYPDGVFLDKFSDWLVSHFGHTQKKKKIPLLPEIGNVPKRFATSPNTVPNSRPPTCCARSTRLAFRPTRSRPSGRESAKSSDRPTSTSCC